MSSRLPKLRVDAHVIGNVVAPVVVRRRHGGGQPDGVDAEPGEVVKLVDHPGKVAVAVTVGVVPGPHVQLIHRPRPTTSSCPDHGPS